MGTPKAFISYSWSSPGHRDRIRSYAERLVGDGVEVILDQWDLSEGQDKYAFMEKTVTDASVTHVLVFSDSQYASKANERKAGVGTESQLISKEIYDRVEQTTFIPIVCEKDENGKPCLPAFLCSRIWIDFSTPEAVNENWEKVIRVLFGKPMYTKPSPGSPPSYLSEAHDRPALPTTGKFASLKDALLNGKPTVELARKDFLSAAIAYADSLRVREKPKDEHLDEKILADCRALLPLRDQLIDWLLLEASLPPTARFDDILTRFMEHVLALKYRPNELSSWNPLWFEAHALFAYEFFIYVIAALISTDRFETIRHLITARYLLPKSEVEPGRDLVRYDEFCAYPQALDKRNARLNLLRERVALGLKALGGGTRDMFFAAGVSLSNCMNVEALDTLP